MLEIFMTFFIKLLEF